MIQFKYDMTFTTWFLKWNTNYIYPQNQPPPPIKIVDAHWWPASGRRIESGPFADEVRMLTAGPSARSQSSSRYPAGRGTEEWTFSIWFQFQLNALSLVYYISFIFLYMFRAILCSSSGGSIVYTQHLVLYMSLFLCDRSVYRQLEDWHSPSSNCLCTERSHKKSDI